MGVWFGGLGVWAQHCMWVICDLARRSLLLPQRVEAREAREAKEEATVRERVKEEPKPKQRRTDEAVT